MAYARLQRYRACTLPRHCSSWSCRCYLLELAVLRQVLFRQGILLQISGAKSVSARWQWRNCLNVITFSLVHPSRWADTELFFNGLQLGELTSSVVQAWRTVSMKWSIQAFEANEVCSYKVFAAFPQHYLWLSGERLQLLRWLSLLDAAQLAIHGALLRRLLHHEICTSTQVLYDELGASTGLLSVHGNNICVA